MEIVLVRHATAVERSLAIDDTVRPLSARGRRRFARAVDGMAHLGLRIDHIFHSPWLRAVETAEMLDPVNFGSCEATLHLADDPGADLLALAAPFADSARVAFVGHEPWMSELLALLLLGDTRYGEIFPFKKGGVAWLAGEPRPGEMLLRALLPPRALRRMAPVPEPLAED